MVDVIGNILGKKKVQKDSVSKNKRITTPEYIRPISEVSNIKIGSGNYDHSIHPRSQKGYHVCVDCGHTFSHEDRGVDKSPWLCNKCNPS